MEKKPFFEIKTMTSESNMIQELPSFDMKKEGKLNKEEECEYYRQRFNSLKIISEEIEAQLTVYKNRCLGVDTIVLALQESKQENVKLSKHVKALETAISILQKRLAQHGLSNSVNIQGTELFVPGASKQTLDNLAKENARLRSLLKQENGHFRMKPSDELEDVKVVLEETECENNKLLNKLKTMEALKLTLTRDYEVEINKLHKQLQDQKAKFEEELKACSARQQAGHDKRYENEQNSVGLQVNIVESSSVQQLKHLLKLTVEKCSELDDQLPHCPIETPSSMDCNALQGTSNVVISEQDYKNLENRHQEAVLMNQKWQMFSKEREKQIQALNDRILELSDPHMMAAMIEEATQQKTAQMTHEMRLKDAELLELRKQVQGMSKDLTDARKLQQENSTVEILKQQIQVCTEDFNTERRDREQAVQKARALQEENDKLKTEKINLKKQIDGLKRIAEQQQRQQPKPPMNESSLTSSYSSESPSSSQYSNQFSPNPRYSQHLVPVQETPTFHAVEPLGPRPQGIPFSDYQGPPPSFVQSNVYRSQASPDANNYSSMSRNGPSPPRSSTPPLNNMSMPPMVRRGGNVKEELPCPKCSKPFSEDILLCHIEECMQ